MLISRPPLVSLFTQTCLVLPTLLARSGTHRKDLPLQVLRTLLSTPACSWLYPGVAGRVGRGWRCLDAPDIVSILMSSAASVPRVTPPLPRGQSFTSYVAAWAAS